MSTIYITGATGFLGSNLANDLKRKKYNVVIITRKKKLLIDGFQIINMRKNFVPSNSILIHLAESNDVKKINRLGNIYFEKATSFLKKILNYNWKHVIYASSVLVYGARCNKKHSPLKKLKPYNIYTKNKLYFENLVLKKDGTVLRFTNIYGKGMSKNNLFSDIFKQVKKKSNILEVKNLLPIRDYLWIDDAVNAIKCAIEKKPNDILNIGTGSSFSVLEIIKIIRISYNINIKNIKSIEKNKNIDVIRLNINKTKKTLDWVPETHLKVVY